MHPRRSIPTLVLTVALAAALCGTVARASDRNIPRPQIVKLVGWWGPPQAGHNASADLTLDLRGKPARFQVEESVTIAGNQLGSELLNDIRQYRPSLRLTGPAELLQQLVGLPDGAAVTITGYRPQAARYFMVASVDVATPEP